MIIGILALQGSFIEHQQALTKLGIKTILVKTPQELAIVDGLIIPGGESTVIGKLLQIFDLVNPLKARLNKGMPCYGTCAGMIVLAKNIVGEQPYLQAIDITVLRNAYGRQLASFKTNKVIEMISSKAIPLVFIRAPWIEEVGKNVEILLEIDGHIVCAKENNILVSSFHPELTDDDTIYRYFIKMIENKNR